MKYWRGDFVTVFPKGRWEFHRCILCDARITFGTKAAKTGVGPECEKRRTASDLDRLREDVLAGDRRR